MAGARTLVSAGILLAFLRCSYEPPETVDTIQVLYAIEPEGDRVPLGWLKVDRDGDGAVDRTLYVWHDRTWTLGDETDVQFTNLEVASGRILDDGTLDGFPADGLAGAAEAWVEGDIEVLIDGSPVPRG